MSGVKQLTNEDDVASYCLAHAIVKLLNTCNTTPILPITKWHGHCLALGETTVRERINGTQE